MASKDILADFLRIEAVRKNTGNGCTIVAHLGLRQVFVADRPELGPKRALIAAQRDPAVVRELVRLTIEAKKAKAQADVMAEFADDPEIALYAFESESFDEAGFEEEFRTVIESDPYVTA